MEAIDLPSLMDWLGCKSPSDCWLYNDRIVDKTGIRLKPLDKNTESLLIGDEWRVHKEYEKNICLNLPCTLDEVKDWAQRNFGDLLDESELLKERQKAFAEIKASRTPAYKKVGGKERSVSATELLENSISELLARQNPKDDNERHFLLHTWLNPLRDAIAIQNSMWNKLCEAENNKEARITPSDRRQYDEALDRIHRKEDEIYQLLSDEPPDENPTPTPILEYGEPELSSIDAIGLYPALKLLSDDWTAEEFALQVFYGAIRAFEKKNYEAEKLRPVTNIQDWLKNHAKAEAFGGESYSIKKALLKFNYSKSEISQFKPEYRYISYQQAIKRISELIGDIVDAEEFLIDAIEQHKIFAFYPFVGRVTPELSLNGERWRNGYFGEWHLNRLLTDEFSNVHEIT